MPSDRVATGFAVSAENPDLDPDPDRSWFLLWNRRGDGTCCCHRGAACDRPGKHPWWTRTKQGFEHGHRDAVGWAEVQALASGRRTVRLGRATGVGAGGMVLDADGLPGVADLLRVWDTLPWADGVHGVVRTPRGVHVHLSGWVGRREDGEGEGWTSAAAQRRLRERGLRTLEVKGRGSYVVWPDGTERVWLEESGWERWRERAERQWAGQMGWVRGWTAGGQGSGGWPWQEVYTGGVEVEPVDTDEDRAEGGGWRDGQADAVQAEDSLARACWAVRQADSGARNNLLNWAGFVAGRPALAAGVEQEQVVEMLRAAGRAAGLEWGEVERTVRSGLGLVAQG